MSKGFTCQGGPYDRQRIRLEDGQDKLQVFERPERFLTSCFDDLVEAPRTGWYHVSQVTPGVLIWQGWNR